MVNPTQVFRNMGIRRQVLQQREIQQQQQQEEEEQPDRFLWIAIVAIVVFYTVFVIVCTLRVDKNMPIKPSNIGYKG
ncbi:hypothetical protein CRE_04188 [Caenorhabditis remanei]|uniref:Uncharacterized protein n=1 Tax=Caenorhabditis remanei TaxID=31234 RepID=E3MYW4_CAERE|nr:hypothetical protein CRE_04188 [Caenorhabditis remanei]